jgi:putative transposase
MEYCSEVIFTGKLFGQKCRSTDGRNDLRLFPKHLESRKMEEKGLLTLSQADWEKAKHRAEVIGPLSEMSIVSKIAAEDAAARLGISSRMVYELIRRYRRGEGVLTDVASKRSSGGKGKTRTPAEVNAIIDDVVATMYLSKQRTSGASVIREIRMRCRKTGLKMPAGNTIRARFRSLDPMLVVRRREGADAARNLCSAGGQGPKPTQPLDVVQIDHSPVDVIVVEERSRESIGRPYLTLGIDTFTRCIVGMLLTFEAPSATSVGLCLAHMVADKSSWLSSLGIEEMDWPMHGKARLIHLDNAPEFKSEALKRGCDQHGIERDYRPKGQPHYGGIIERVIGTAMTKVHELPGTTFSNTKERGYYDSEATAILTLRELEKWLTLAIGIYHNSVHSSLWETPAGCWRSHIESTKLYTVRNARAFLIDFLPVIRRNVNRAGFVIDHICYYSDVLKPWIARRHSLDKFIIRRDPRDISRVWVLDPESKQYIEVPYRSFANPAVTIWEHRKAVEKLRDRGRGQVNEQAIFRLIAQMREITAVAGKEKKRARLEHARRSHLLEQQPITVSRPVLAVSENDDNEHLEVKPFDDIEDW